MAVPEKLQIEVIYSELDFSAQKSLHTAFRSALKEHVGLEGEQLTNKLSQTLKEHADKTSSPGWSCIVGSSYASAFAFDDLMHHFLTDRHAVLLFRCV